MKALALLEAFVVDLGRLEFVHRELEELPGKSAEVHDASVAAPEEFVD
jgi:hypothetical protein